MLKIKTKISLNLILLFSIFALLYAYYVEYILGHKPCNLCIIERIPYILTILLVTLNLITKQYEKIILILLSLIFIFATLIASSEISIAIILAFINSLASEIAIAPDPVPISNILILECLFLIIIN